MGEFVHQQQSGAALEGCVHVELAEHLAAIGYLAHRQHRQTAQFRLGAGPPMGLDDAAEHVLALGLAVARLNEHLPRLADAGCGAEEDFQAAAGFRRGMGDQGVGVGAAVSGHGAHVGCPPVKGLG